MKKLCTLFIVMAVAVSMANAAPTAIDLIGASTGTSIIAPGGSFASIFDGQAGTGGMSITGSPTGPLTLKPTYTLEVAPWFLPSPLDDGMSILPQNGFNSGPLSLLLDSDATDITWTMGSSAGSPHSVTIDFFALDGSLVNSTTQVLISGYNVYSYGSFGAFRGLTIHDNNDPAGMRFMNFEYDSAPIPAPGALMLGSMGVGFVSWLRRRRTL